MLQRFPELVLVGLDRVTDALAIAGERLASFGDRVHLVQCTFARPDAWQNWKETHDADRPLQGLKEIALLGLGGYWKLGLSIRDHVRDRFRERARQRQAERPTPA